AVVVAGDGARADIDAGADVTVAHVAEMIDLAARADRAVLDLDEIAQVHAGGQARAGPQVRERADTTVRSDLRFVYDAVRVQQCARADAAVAKDAIAPDVHPVFEPHRPLQRDVHIQQHIAAHLDRTLQIDARRIDDGDPLLHQLARPAPTVLGFGRRKLQPIID